MCRRDKGDPLNGLSLSERAEVEELKSKIKAGTANEDREAAKAARAARGNEGGREGMLVA